MNFGAYPMASGMSRLRRALLRRRAGACRREGVLNAKQARKLGLVTATPDDIDWEDEVRIAIEERASLSPDALTGMEASLRFAGAGDDADARLRPPDGVAELDFHPAQRGRRAGRAKVYGTGAKAKFNWERV